MNLSFNLDQFFALLKNYNLAIWPMQVVAYVLGIAALLLTVRKTKYSGSIISAILAFFWLWTGGLFNLVYFRKFYPLAILFVVLFIIQGVIFVVAGIIKPKFSFRLQWNAYSITGIVLALYALAGYPLLESLWGRAYPRSLPFGLVPCPTTLFTLALFLLADKNLPWYVFTIPITYAICGIVPLANGIHEDIGLVIGGVVTLILILYRNQKKEKIA
jgi:hypothetical protein